MSYATCGLVIMSLFSSH